MTTATLKKPAVKKQKQKSQEKKLTPEELLVKELITLMESGKNPWIKEWDCRNHTCFRKFNNRIEIYFWK